ncbi:MULTISPECIES: alpha/beta fold hydrolase [Kocuria]|nr:alpha/beta hydrolase [Kocuria rhizophila]KUP26696.1 hydrolase [Kocuria rhizophila]MCT1916057.1 alpha/beta hydrolase [Kocuria rhizophila]WIW68515.1 alpha/beta hydrolase [Kocuria sp. ChxB]WSQ05216.1 alpha/beta hydrolase [Kocuria rhizophila]
MDNPYAERRSVVLDGYRVRYWFYDADKQRKPLLVMLHGFRGDHHGLQLIATALRDKYHVVVPDLPGFGRSEPFPEREHSVDEYVRFTRDFITALTDGAVTPDSGTGVVLAGHSFGSILAAHFAAEHPSMVERLVLINPISQPALSGSQKSLTKLTRLYYGAGSTMPRRLGTRLLSSNAVVKLMTDVMIKSEDPEIKHYALRQHQAYFNTFANRDVLTQAYDASISRTVAEVAMKLTMPTLLIVGELDDLGSVDSQRTMASWIRSHSLQIIPGVGHLIHYEAPQTAARMIEDFLESPAPEPLEGYDQLPHADTTVSTPDQLTGMLPAVDPAASAAQFRRETRARGLSGESER